MPELPLQRIRVRETAGLAGYQDFQNSAGDPGGQSGLMQRVGVWSQEMGYEALLIPGCGCLTFPPLSQCRPSKCQPSVKSYLCTYPLNVSQLPHLELKRTSGLF